MSFILDALKKSENARQRQIGPAVAELPRRRRQSERPIWAFVVAALLLITIGMLGAVLARKQGGEVTATAAMTTNPMMAANAAQGVDPAMQQMPQDIPTVLPARQQIQYAQQQYPQQYQQQQYPQYQQSQQYQNEQMPAQFGGPPPGNAGGNPGMRSLAEESAADGLEGDSGLAAAFAAAQADVEREERQAAPIQAPAVAPLGSASSQARSIPAGGAPGEILPTIGELAASGRTFPTMRLDIHSFADKPADRFIFVNMRKYGEGSTLQEGPAVERITEEGVVLNQQGLRFLLPRP